jgi:hypothetical protein
MQHNKEDATTLHVAQPIVHHAVAKNTKKKTQVVQHFLQQHVVER